MLEEFIDSALIIDDKENEIKELRSFLEEKDIWVTYHNPPKKKQEIDIIPKPFRNRKLIFLDLRLDETKKTIDNISVIIRPLLSKIISNNFGNYGIVMWTKHDAHIEEFKTKIQKDSDRYQLPLFIVRLDKSKYIKQKSFKSIFSDLEAELEKSVAANFFINWSNLINKGRNKAITSVFELVPDYQKQDKNLEYLLFKMAQNYTGIPFDQIDGNYPLIIDAIKAFNDILTSNVNALSNKINITFDKNKVSFSKNDETTVKPSTRINKVGDELMNLFAKLNNKLLIDNINIKQETVIPGNVYEIKSDKSKLIHPELPKDSLPIIIEMTPPCDFSNQKSTYPRVLSGYILELDSDLKNKPKSSDGENIYKEFWPIKIEEKNQVIVFDFSILGFVEKDDLKKKSEYKLLFRVKDKLFADILQKMSSHISRLGLSIIR